jgi:signal transduction histidine kinase
MRLSEFILLNLEEILTEWESFAGTVLPDSKFTKIVLRNSAEEILKAIAKDMETPQSASEQAQKSTGHGRRPQEDSAAETHAAERLRLDFNQAQLVSEYRALRATVLRLWVESLPDLADSSNVHQLIRFNEGIDQALTESTVRFMHETDAARDLAVAVMAHDLKNPLNAIVSTAQILQTPGFDKFVAVDQLGANMLHSGTLMSKLIDNLLDFTRARFGQPLIVKRELIDLSLVCERTVAEFVTAHPKRTIRADCGAGIDGDLDKVRISQMLANLISNAIQHGDPSTPVSVNAHSESKEIVLTVHNHGAPIPQSGLQTIFDPFTHAAKQGKYTRHLGLGLFVAREIVEAHAGKISVTSTAEDGTKFVVRLPRYTTPA